MKADDLGPHWKALCTDLRLWREEIEEKAKAVQEYELFECRTKQKTTQVLAEAE